jgi:hypothetical protein
MVPFGLSESQFIERYRSALMAASGGTVEQLRALLSRPLEAGVTAAQVEIFIGEYGESPDFWMYFDGRNNKIDKSDTSLFPGRSLHLPLALQRLGEFDERYFEFESFRGSDIAANELKAWFGECWQQAGGESYAVPVTLAVHDGFGDGKVVALSKGGG